MKPLNKRISKVQQPQFDEEMIKQLITGLDIGRDNSYYAYIQGQGALWDITTIDRGQEAEFFKTVKRGVNQGDQFQHIGGIEDIEYAISRLYINCQKQDIIPLAQIFTKKCKEKEIPFYFKYSTSQAQEIAAQTHRADKIVIYSNINELENYIEILENIAEEHPEIIERCGEPPILTGKLNHWIGIGVDPSNRQKESVGRSYTEVRAKIIEDVLLRLFPEEPREPEDLEAMNIDFGKVRGEIEKELNKYGISLKNFSFNEENISLYMADDKTRQEYHTQRGQQIRAEEEAKQQKEIEKAKQEEMQKTFLENISPEAEKEKSYFLQLKELQNMGIMTEEVGVAIKALAPRYGFLLDINPKTSDVADAIKNEYGFPEELIKRQSLQVISRGQIQDLSEEQRNEIASKVLSGVKSYYTQYFKTESSNLQETLDRYAELQSNLDEKDTVASLENTNVYTKLNLLANGKSFFQQIGISEEETEIVSDRVSIFLQSFGKSQNVEEQKTKEQENTAEYLAIALYQTGITDMNKLREYYKQKVANSEWEDFGISEEELEDILQEVETLYGWENSTKKATENMPLSKYNTAMLHIREEVQERGEVIQENEQ